MEKYRFSLSIDLCVYHNSMQNLYCAQIYLGMQYLVLFYKRLLANSALFLILEKSLNQTEKRYSTLQIELMALVKSFLTISHFLCGRYTVLLDSKLFSKYQNLCPTSGAALKLVDGRWRVKSPVELIDLAVWSFLWFSPKLA